jgi:two-component system, OmpR family, sensor histidine kinase TctE
VKLTAKPASRQPQQGGLRLSRQLLLWVMVPQVVLWLAGGLAAYVLAASYVDQALDNGLLQSSRSLARQLKPLGNGLMVDFPRAAQTVIEADPQDRQYYMVSSPPGQFVLGNRTLPPPPEHIAHMPKPDVPYFYDGQMPIEGGKEEPTQRVRAVALYLVLDGEINAEPQQVLVQLARSNNTREQLVQRILVDMLLPLSTLVLLMTFIVWWGIRRGLAPIKALTEQVEGRAPSNLAPLQLDRAPQELHSLAGALNTLLDDAKHHLEVQKRFIGDAAHQLRTPMAGLKSQTELALAETHDPALHKRLAHVHESATRCAHLVTQLLTLARAAPEAAPAHLQTLDLPGFLQDIVSEWVPKALRSGVDLGWDESSAQAAQVLAEPTLLREALANVIDNAIRYAGAGAEVTVGLNLEKDGGAGFAQIWVQDNGPGIAPSDLTRVFERFYRGTESGTGCGLGLAIVRDIVQRHGGSVSLQAHQPQGLVVQMRLPLAA